MRYDERLNADKLVRAFERRGRSRSAGGVIVHADPSHNSVPRGPGAYLNAAGLPAVAAQRGLGTLTPVEYELAFAPQVDVTAA